MWKKLADDYRKPDFNNKKCFKIWILDCEDNKWCVQLSNTPVSTFGLSNCVHWEVSIIILFLELSKSVFGGWTYGIIRALGTLSAYSEHQSILYINSVSKVFISHSASAPKAYASPWGVPESSAAAHCATLWPVLWESNLWPHPVAAQARGLGGSCWGRWPRLGVGYINLIVGQHTTATLSTLTVETGDNGRGGGRICMRPKICAKICRNLC